MSDIINLESLAIHLKERHNINIENDIQKQSLKNYGYYHGYKGYRYIRETTNRITFSNFDQIVALNVFDMELKSIFYPYIMFIETALKNHVLEEVLIAASSYNFEDIYNSQITHFKEFDKTTNKGLANYRMELKKRLSLKNKIYTVILRDYSNDKKIVQHFYDRDKILPIWAIFEIITMGEFGLFVSCLDTNIKKSISLSIGLNRTCDSDAKLLQGIIYLLRDLRNSIAHNDVIFDARFRSIQPSKSTRLCIELESKINKITYVTIVDYFILVIYLLKKLQVNKSELLNITKRFIESIEAVREKIPSAVYSQIFHTDTRLKLNELINFINKP